MLHYKTVEPDTLELLKELMQISDLHQFFLVGGTALSLQLGHRKSIDLDLFTVQDFSSDEVLLLLSKAGFTVSPTLQYPQTLICLLNNIKVDFIRFRYNIIRPIIETDGIRMLSVDDIAPMKMDAITGRGSKKDFFDFYYLLKKYSLDELFNLYLEKYPNQTTFHVARSLSYFKDAENDPDPICFDPKLTWPKVKAGINDAIRRL